MNVPIRALSWATRFFWIMVLAFAVTCAYSVTLVRVNFGEPILTSTEEDFTVTLPIIFDNKGYYNIADFNVTTLIVDYENRQISKAAAYIAQIPPQNNAIIFHNVSFNVNEIMTRVDYLFDDSNFTLYGSIYLNYANLIPFGFEANATIPWGAPLFNFTTDMPEYSAYNTTHLGVNVPISFQNHSPYFTVTGTIRIEIFNDRNQLMGEDTASIDVPSNADYDNEIGMLVNAGMLTERGQIRVYVETEMFDYGPMVINYG
ncbi:MAG: hypothetical protein OEY24_05735 [Candidatus Bathyarchaeota archaeon]|nr:hypothetical protein [Candidatus Bathyarchaeota archaeon]MDH5495186.1 hypothetical protein [Candidatus Bathyarchaeota archaeon]